MYFSGIQIPDELMRALRANEVVFFCGAGVSSPPPSNLPMFDGLARQIAGVAELPQDEKEDAFLGRLSRDNINVHELAARILVKKDSTPTDLHYDLLRLFRQPENVRVVTTNFDSHFSTANEKVFRKKKAAEHIAPILPLGEEFSGIVYLHGAAAISDRHLILTDEDFGKAYITRGWARRFLIPLFQNYVVVFLGYSHQDVTMTYLARGLTAFPTRKRFAFCIDGAPAQDYQRWKSLGVDVIRYPKAPQDSTNHHASLSDGIRELGRFLGRSLTKQIKQMRSRVRGLPPEGEEHNALLKHWLDTPPLAIEFCRMATRLEWCEWLREHGYFDCLFEKGDSNNPRNLPPHLELHLIQFAAGRVRPRFPSWLLGMLTQKKRPLSAKFAEALLQSITAKHNGTSKTDQYFGAWVNLLLQQSRECLSGYRGARLLLHCELPKQRVLALAILEQLVRPVVEFEASQWPSPWQKGDEQTPIQLSATDLSPNLSWGNGAGHPLATPLTEFLSMAFRKIPHDLCLWAVRILESAHELVPAVALVQTKLQRLDFGRSAIAEHEQDRHRRHDLINILIDVARDSIAHLVKSDRAWAIFQIQQWWQSEIPLLHRLALFAHTRDVDMSADELLMMVIDRCLLFALPTKKETFDLLAFAYPLASTKCRQTLIAAIAGQNGMRRSAKNSRSVSVYERYNVLVWLQTHVPTCEIVLHALKIIKTANPDFLPRSHPDIDVWVEAARESDSGAGTSFEDIIAGSPTVFLENILQAPPYGIGPNRCDMCSNLKELSNIDRDWVLRFLMLAAESPAVDSALWSTILMEYSSLLKTTEDWLQFRPVLELLLRNEQSLDGVVWLVDHTIWRGRTQLPVDLIELCMKFVDLAWCQRSKTTERERQVFRDWYTTAINHLGGWIGDSWFHYCSYLKQDAARPWNGIPENIRAALVEAVTGRDQTAFYARIAVTPWIAYLFVWDPEFAKRHLLPLFDWSRDAEVSQQTWSVFLWYARGSSTKMELELRPHYKKFAHQLSEAVKEAGEHLEQFNQDCQNRFGHYIARIALEAIDSHERLPFLEDFIAVLTPAARNGLAHAITDRLKEMVTAECEDAWQDWLRDYLDLRLLGRPALLSPEESEPFAEFALRLRQSFPEFVDRFVRMPLLKFPIFDIVEELKPRDVWRDFPVPTCRFLTHMLLSCDGFFDPAELNEIHALLKQGAGATAEFRALEDAMIMQGWRP